MARPVPSCHEHGPLIVRMRSIRPNASDVDRPGAGVIQ